MRDSRFINMEQVGRSNSSKSEPNNGVTVRRLLAILGFASVLIATAQARIGETESEIRAHYGDPIGILPSTVQGSLTKHYLSGGFSIAVTYVSGRSARETLAKADNSKITEKEIRLLLDANAGGYAWSLQQLDNQKNAPTDLLIWRTDDQHSRVAFYDSRAQAFFVTTQRFVNLTNAMNRRTAARMRNGGFVTGGHSERLTRSLKKEAVGAMLRDREPKPSPSPARPGG
jgi:hypothetical protein